MFKADNIERRLRQAIDDAFAPDQVRSFLGALEARNGRIRHIEEASVDLTAYLTGGAYGKEPYSEINFIDPYQELDEQRRGGVKNLL